MNADDSLTIGAFARVSGLTIKALRHYDATGLLRPARVDPDTGYRFYTLEQARRAEAIRRLRELELPLAEVATVLLAPPDERRAHLERHRAALARRQEDLERAVGELTRLIDGEEALVPDRTQIRFELDVKDVPPQRVATVTDRAHVDDMTLLVPRQIEEVHAYLEEVGVRAVGPPFCICPFPDADGMLSSETGWPVSEDVVGRGRIQARTLPAARALVLRHTGPYETLSRSYRLLSEVMEENGFRASGDPREIYVTDPEEVGDPADYVTEIVQPVGPDGELVPRDHFRRRVPADA